MILHACTKPPNRGLKADFISNVEGWRRQSPTGRLSFPIDWFSSAREFYALSGWFWREK